jgi:hypothetical protein
MTGRRKKLPMNTAIAHNSKASLLLSLIKRTSLGRGFLLMALAATIAWFALLGPAHAQDGDELNGNTAEGADALSTYLMTASSAEGNTAIGYVALTSDTTGNFNTATGSTTLDNNTTGNFNTATGANALEFNTTASANTAVGDSALRFNTTGPLQYSHRLSSS